MAINTHHGILRSFAAILLLLTCGSSWAAGDLTVMRWRGPDGKTVAWLTADGTLNLTKAYDCNQSIQLSSNDEWYIQFSSGTIFNKIALSGADAGKMWVKGTIQTGPNKTHPFYVTNPWDASKVIMSISATYGYLHLTSGTASIRINVPADENMLTSAALFLPPYIQARSVSPIFPTPAHWSNLPEAFKAEGEGVLGKLSPQQICSMFVYWPNWKWDDKNDNFQDFDNYENVNISDLVNDTGSEIARPAFSADGKLYALGGDSIGLQAGKALFNRSDDNNSSKANLALGRINGMKPGRFTDMQGLKNAAPIGKNLGWLHSSQVIDLVTPESQARKGTNFVTGFGSMLCIKTNRPGAVRSDLFKAYYLDRITTGVANLDNGYGDPERAGIICWRDIDNFAGDGPGGNEWDGRDDDGSDRTWSIAYDPNRYPNNYNSATNPFRNNIRLTSDTAADYDMGYDPGAEEKWNENKNTMCARLTENTIWKNYKFTIPKFILFGKGYEDYSEPDANAFSRALQGGESSPGAFRFITDFGQGTRTTDTAAFDLKFVYCLSHHYQNIFDGDALYLGRCPIGLGKGAYASWDPQWGKWEYYKGIDLAGRPIWTADIDQAKSVITSANCELGSPHAMYEPRSRIFIMGTAWTNQAQSLHLNARGFIWVARKPWGPWRKVHSSDFNGMQNRPAQDVRRQGGGYYFLHVMSNRDWIDASELDAAGYGKLRFWILLGGSFTRDHYLGYFRDPTWPLEFFYWKGTGGHTTSHVRDNSLWIPWDEVWKQTYYTLCFQQIELNIASEPSSAGRPAVVECTIPSRRPEGKFKYDHWGWRPQFNPATKAIIPSTANDFRLDPIWVGYQFQVGPQPIVVTKLGRHYITGNTDSHRVVIVNGAGAAVADMTIPMNELKPGKPNFESAKTVSEDGFIYRPLPASVTLQANTTYTLLSREGLDASLNNSADLRYSCIESCKGGGPTVQWGVTSGTMWLGYRFRTGPLGLRITHLMRMKDDRRDTKVVSIAEATIDQITNPSTFNDNATSISSATINNTLMKRIGDIDFVIQKLVKPVDLKPLKEYYIGVLSIPGDTVYPATYAGMKKILFNPNYIQFMHPARCINGLNNPWFTLHRENIRPKFDSTSVYEGEAGKYEDGVGLLSPVEAPVGFLGLVPDRFEGWRPPVDYRGLQIGDKVTMPIFDLAGFKPFKVLSSFFTQREGTFDINNLGPFHEKPDWPFGGGPYLYGPPNSCFGPLDVQFDVVGGASDNKMIDGDLSKFIACKTAMDKPAGFDNRMYKSSYKFNSECDETSRTIGGPVGGYAGMLIEIGDKPLRINRIGRFYEKGLTTTTQPLPVHDVILFQRRAGLGWKDGDLSRTRQYLLAVGRIDPNDSACGQYTSSTGSFLWTDLYKPENFDPTTTRSTWTRIDATANAQPGYKYFVGCWEKPTDPGLDRPLGWPDDFCHLTAGSGIKILGPARTTSSTTSGLPDVSGGKLHVVRMDSSDKANPQGYGPFNFIYQPAAANSLTLFSGMTGYNSSAGTGAYTGIKLKTGRNPVMVTALGRCYAANNSKLHHVLLLKAHPSAGDKTTTEIVGFTLNIKTRQSQVVASALVKADSAKAENGYNYSPLEQPVVLEPCTEYFLASYEDAQDSYPVRSYTTTITYNSAVADLLGYNGSTPQDISEDDENFEIDNQAWALSGDGYWDDCGDLTFMANVNMKVQ